MSDPAGQPELSEVAIQVLQELDELEKDHLDVSEETLFYFLVGWLPPVDRNQVIDALTRSAFLQERLIATEAALRRETPKKLVGESIQIFRRLAREGIVSFGADATSLVGLLRRDRFRLGIAQTRSGTPDTLTIGDHSFRISAEVTAAGVLIIHGTREPQSILGGSPDFAWLELVDDVLGRIPLGMISLRNSEFNLQTSAGGLALGEGPVPVSAITFREDSTSEPLTIVAEGRFLLELAATPSIQGEVLLLSFVPTADFAGRTLEIGLRIGKYISPLGSWPILDLLETLHVSVPGQPDGPLPPFALSIKIS